MAHSTRTVNVPLVVALALLSLSAVSLGAGYSAGAWRAVASCRVFFCELLAVRCT